MTFLFAGTLFVSSALLFLIQPWCGKMVLPLLGGSPVVWNTCMVFFQAGLLGGYAYAHAGPSFLGLYRHALVHLLFLGLALFLLPVSLPADTDNLAQSAPFFWLFRVLLVGVGIPFILVASSGPLLQRWFAQTGSIRARDPYFLYAASNLGSLMGLLAYPFLVEPTFSLVEQQTGWTVGYGILATLTLVCAVPLFLARNKEESAPTLEEKASPHPGWPVRWRWLVLALVPVSLMLSVTTYLTTDIAAIPLLWVLPLGLYLLTYTLAFAERQVLPRSVVVRWLPLVLLLLAVILLSQAAEPVWLLVAVNLSGLFWIALACHGELAHTRPPAKFLTGFYLWLAFGGILGGLFNALLAPVLFHSVAEFPLMLVLAALIRPTDKSEKAWSWNDLILPLGLGLSTAGLILLIRTLGLETDRLGLVLILPPAALACYLMTHHRWRFGLGLAALLLAGSLYQGIYGQIEDRLRSFFGVHRITRDGAGEFRYLVHGNTVHGQQRLGPDGGSDPLTYYHREGPAGQFFRALQGDPRLQKVALVGLGTGALAAYAQPGQHWTFFEIDPAVIHLARDAGWFNYLKQSAGKIDVVEGDGRLSLARTGEKFGVIVLDAFSSDAIPLHLLTREALQVYRDHLEPNGLLLVHISNRFLDLEPVLANLAADAQPPMVGRMYQDLAKDEAKGKFPSEWVALANHPGDLAKLPLGTTLRPHSEKRVWTDDYSNLFQALRK